jgi:hypothetical protein
MMTRAVATRPFSPCDKMYVLTYNTTMLCVAAYLKISPASC